MDGIISQLAYELVNQAPHYTRDRINKTGTPSPAEALIVSHNSSAGHRVTFGLGRPKAFCHSRVWPPREESRVFLAETRPGSAELLRVSLETTTTFPRFGRDEQV